MSEQLPEHRDIEGKLWMDTDHATTANANYAAENGKWTKWAQPGFEQDTEQIGIDARAEADTVQIPVTGSTSTSQKVEVHAGVH